MLSEEFERATVISTDVSERDEETTITLSKCYDAIFTRNVCIAITVYSAGVAWLGDKPAWNMAACGVALSGMFNMMIAECQDKLGRKVKFPGLIKYADIQPDIDKFKRDFERYYRAPFRRWWSIVGPRFFHHP